jgi:quercetin dioxygenase-like cupin family protein
LPITPARQYLARYMEATFPPNQAMQTTVHRHSGSEAWYVVTGAQCLRTPESTTILRAGEGGFVPPGPPMVLTAMGTETRRALVLVLHDASQPWQTNTTEWTPTRECPRWRSGPWPETVNATQPANQHLRTRRNLVHQA